MLKVWLIEFWLLKVIKIDFIKNWIKKNILNFLFSLILCNFLFSIFFCGLYLRGLYFFLSFSYSIIQFNRMNMFIPWAYFFLSLCFISFVYLILYVCVCVRLYESDENQNKDKIEFSSLFAAATAAAVVCASYVQENCWLLMFCFNFPFFSFVYSLFYL